jgi:lipoprotein-anchoring transpeptidase ErfK/SrfK
VTVGLLIMASVALALPAGAQGLEPVIVPPASTTVAPTTVAPPTTVPPTTAPPTTVAPEPTTTVPVVTEPPTTVVATVPVTATPTTTKKKPAIEVGNPQASGSVSLEVSIARQVMIIRKGGDVWKTIPVSTGSGRKYCNKGKCGNAVTPRGRYRIYSRVSGWRTAALGRLYNPLYFKGGFAVHGSGSVPRYPASHGCVRVSIANARWLPSAIPNGTSIWIH